MRRPVLLPALAFVLLAGPLGAPPATAVPATRNMVLKAQWNEYLDVQQSSSYAACWAYVHPDGREYAVIGTRGGTAIYNISNLDATYRVGFIPGPTCLWREMKSYRTWIYTVSECQGADEGLQIISMEDPENPVLVDTYTTNFNRSHTVSVDTTRAVLICNGTRNPANQSTGMRILSLADPGAPVEIGWWPGGAVPVSSTNYVHDSVPVGDRLYASSINAGIERILDFTIPATPVEIHSWTYEGAFSHNSWPDASGDYLYVTDEVNGEPLKIFDISVETTPVLVDTFTPNDEAIVHNAHVAGDELYLANYTEGVRILDLSDPAHPAEFAWADTWEGASGGFFGVWEFCPYFPSGAVIASDMQSGLYVFEVQRDYGLITVQVEESAGGTPLEGVEVRLLEQGDRRTTSADGVVRFGPSPGSHTVRVSPFGYEPFEGSVVVSDGSDDTLLVSLVAKPTVDFTGTVVDDATSLPLEDAEISLVVSPLHEHTDAAGAFFFPAVPADEYELFASRPGYLPFPGGTRQIAPPVASQDIRMIAAPLWDDLEAASGWTVGVAGDNATTGIWTRVEPLGTGKPAGGLTTAAAGRREPPLEPSHEGEETDGVVPGDVQPEFDRTPPPGTLCFVTGQGTDPSMIGQQDVDNGGTTLTTPSFDATPYGEPTFAYWRWLYATGQADDRLVVSISNDDGASWTPVDTTQGVQAEWREVVVRVADYVPISDQVRLRFQAADDAPGSIVEAAIDDLILYDGAIEPVAAPRSSATPRLSLRLAGAHPAPVARLRLTAPAETGVEVAIYDVAGRRVRRLYRDAVPAGGVALEWSGTDDAGRSLGAGLYFLVARGGGERAILRFVRVD